MAKKKRCIITYTRNGAGRWLASVYGVDGGKATGHSLRTARRRIRVVLAAVDGGSEHEFVDNVKLTTDEQKAIARLAELHAVAEHGQAELRKAARWAAVLLVRTMSLRDAGEVLDLSAARVQQLLRAT